MDPDVKKINLTKSVKYRITQLLEKTKRLIDKKFSYTHVKDQMRTSLMETEGFRKWFVSIYPLRFASQSEAAGAH